MNDLIELHCWACEKPFTIEYGPGRPPRYCGLSCKNLARRIARRARFAQRIEQQRAERAERAGAWNSDDSVRA